MTYLPNREEKIKVHSNGEGRLFIRTAELFASKKVQDIISRAAKLKLNRFYDTK